MNSLISCVIPVFNGEKYFKETLDSVLAQTYRPLEVIVVDDGSTDSTPEIAQTYSGSIKYVRQDNQGVAAAKNTGLGFSRGEFIAILDADDLWHAEKLERQMVKMRQQPEIDLCFTQFQNFWMPELADEEQRYRDSSLAQPSSAWSICTLLAHRSCFQRFGNFHDGTRYLEDMTWCLRARRQGAVIEVLPDILMYRRFNIDSLTRRGRSQYLKGLIPIFKEWRDSQRKRSGK